MTTLHDQDWSVIDSQDPDLRNRREMGNLVKLLQRCAYVRDGFSVDQLTHCLQTAHRLEADGADDALVFCGLVHDAAKPLSVINHPAIVAEIVRDRIPDADVEMLRMHGDMVHTTKSGGRCHGRRRHLHFVEADAASFDPNYDTPDLWHFLPLLRRIYS